MLIPRFLSFNQPAVIPEISYCLSVLMGILSGTRFRFNTDQPQWMVYSSHINEKNAFVIIPSPMLCSMELFILIIREHFTCAVDNV
jgi:hypothetical protein